MANGAGNTTTKAYDPLDRLLSATDPVGRVTRMGYDAAGQTLEETRAYGTALQQNYAQYGYTANGLQASALDANGNLSTMVYDGLDRIKEFHLPVATLGAGQASATDYEAYGYDANGNRTSKRLRSGETIAYTFDALNRETLKDIPGSTADDV